MAKTKFATAKPSRASKARENTARTELMRPEDVAAILQPLAANQVQEHLWCIAIDVRNKVLDTYLVAKGTVDNVSVHPRELFRPAIELAASGIIFAHNHPSGDCTPSIDDRMLTRRMQAAGELLGIPVLDSMVVTDTAIYSIMLDQRFSTVKEGVPNADEDGNKAA